MKKETNYEHYKDEIIKTLLIGGSCRFKKEYILKPEECIPLICPCPCSECEARTKEWLNAPYEEPKIEIDWEKVPEDTPVYVSDYNEYPTDTSLCRYFSTYFKNSHAPFEVWAEGKTSFTTAEVSSYKYCSLARKEDIEKYAKK
ncbi:MAG: hypothetical protein IKT40_08170 [Bacilli bacterium]|nr:hypothetical protein [Bacilli bacterium]